MNRRVLIVDDDPAALRLLEHHLASGGYEVQTAATGHDALRILMDDAPPLLIADWEMPDLNGLDLCRAIRAHEGIGFIYTIIVTSHSDKEHLVQAFDAGADDYMTKPFHAKELLARLRAGERIMALETDLARRTREVFRYNAEMEVANRKLAQANEKLNCMATTDELTGLINRRAGMHRLSELWIHAQRYCESLACIMVDIDHFKCINDTHGHAVGDTVLKTATQSIMESARRDEIVCRVGGEEFVIFCPNSTGEMAAKGAERIRNAVAARPLVHDGRQISVTISLGVAESGATMKGPDDLLRAADQAMYTAKRLGRNRVHVAGGEQTNRGTVMDSTGPPTTAPVSSDDAQNRRSRATRSEQTRRLVLLADLARTVAATDDLDVVLERTLAVITEVTNSHRACIMLPDKDRSYLRIAKAVGLDPRISERMRVPVGAALSGKVFHSRQTKLVNTPVEGEAELDGPDRSLFVNTRFLSVPLGTARNVVGVLNVTKRKRAQPFSAEEAAFIDLIGNIAAAAIQDFLVRRSRDEARDSIVVALAKLAERRDDDTGRHLDRVSQFCMMLATELTSVAEYGDQIDNAFLRDLKRAVPLHDIGKVAIPDAILLKPGRLTPQEMEIMRTHAQIGADTIRSVIERAPDARFLHMAEEIARSHHEWFDGHGYPQGLAGADIPLAARIVALADVYDALTSDRAYRRAMPHAHAAAIILERTGTQFDPAIIQAFRTCESGFQRLAVEMADDRAEPEQLPPATVRPGRLAQPTLTPRRALAATPRKRRTQHAAPEVS